MALLNSSAVISVKFKCPRYSSTLLLVHNPVTVFGRSISSSKYTRNACTMGVNVRPNRPPIDYLMPFSPSRKMPSSRVTGLKVSTSNTFSVLYTSDDMEDNTEEEPLSEDGARFASEAVLIISDTEDFTRDERSHNKTFKQKVPGNESKVDYYQGDPMLPVYNNNINNNNSRSYKARYTSVSARASELKKKKKKS